MKALYMLLVVCLIGIVGCGSYHSHLSYVVENSNKPTGGGLYRVLANNTVQALNNNDVIDWPTSAGDLILRYDSPRRNGTKISSYAWLVDLKPTGEPIRYFISGNPADGDHKISLIVTSAYTGDNQFAGCDTTSITVKTYRDSW